MNVYEKLLQARATLSAMGLKKTGKNTYSKYDYYELADILQSITAVCKEVGLLPVVSFTSETAYMRIYDTQGEGVIEITSPMGAADLKGCHEVQNVGAVETYQRRYLYMTAFDIVDADILDENTGRETAAKKEYAELTVCPECGQVMNAVTMKDGTIVNADAFLKKYGKCSVCVKREKANGKPD